MEITNKEVRAIQTTVADAEQQQIEVLDALQLALVGGGNVIINFG